MRILISRTPEVLVTSRGDASNQILVITDGMPLSKHLAGVEIARARETAEVYASGNARRDPPWSVLVFRGVVAPIALTRQCSIKDV